MKKFYIILAILVVVVGVLDIVYFLTQKSHIKSVKIDNQTFNVELATTDVQREQGLMNRKSLDRSAGMLFVFSNSEIQTFWMKNTLIPFDIIWINTSTPLSTGKIVDIQTLQPPASTSVGLGGQNGTNIPQYTPKEKANYVLEINAGLAEKYGIKIGDDVKLK